MNERVVSLLVILAIAFSFFMGAKVGEDAALDRSAIVIDSITNSYDSTTYRVVINTRDSLNIIDSVVYSSVIDTVPYPLDVDTNAILEDYFKVRQYNVSYLDTNISIDISPVVSLNSLDSVSFEYSILRPTKVVNLSPKSVTEWYGGLEAGRMNVSPFVQVNVKDKWLIGVNYNLLNQSTNLSMGVRLF